MSPVMIRRLGRAVRTLAAHGKIGLSGRHLRTMSSIVGVHSSEEKKRVIGAIAHINSGKTTTSEAMLFTAGALFRMGNVDSGDTTMDFLPAERERGITVNAAAICFDWNDHQFFLVDSPGHLDFTFEVERALQVMDGVIVLLDAVAGVQPQTETVWRQADSHKIPRVLFVNKMDRDGANFERTVQSVKTNFNARPAVVQVPIFKEEGQSYLGPFDILQRFPASESSQTPAAIAGQGDLGSPAAIAYENCSGLQRKEIEKATETLIERVVEEDDDIMALWLEGNPIPRESMKRALRRACITGKLVPVLCGSSLRRIGIEALMESVIDYLPSPEQRVPLTTIAQTGESQLLNPNSSAPFLAYAFKVTHDKHRGRLVHLRVFSGATETGRKQFLNTTKGKTETPTRLLSIFADKFDEVETVTTGDIFAAVGMKHTSTGDTIVSRGTEQSAQVVLEGVKAPPAVFSVALEVDTQSQQRELDEALQRVVETDASLELRYDEDTGETVLSGMGELHLEVTIDHMQRMLPFTVYKSRPRVAYRETVKQSVEGTACINTLTGSVDEADSMTVSISPGHEQDRNSIEIEGQTLSTDEETAVRDGLEAGLQRGPIIGAPLLGVQVVVSMQLTAGFKYESSALRASTVRCVRAALRDGDTVLLEPVMTVECHVPQEYVGDVVAELSHPTRRRGMIEEVGADVTGGEDLSVDAQAQFRKVVASVPISGVIGWVTKMRSLAKGRGHLQMSFREYRQVDRAAHERVVKEILR